MDINRVFLVCRLTRDAELKYSSGGMAISKLSVATNRRKKDGDKWVDDASFFDVTLFGKTAESINQYLLKGKQIAIEGELVQERWEDKEGAKRSAVKINAINIQLLGGAQGEVKNSQGAVNHQIAPPTPSRPPVASAKPYDDGFADDIPF